MKTLFVTGITIKATYMHKRGDIPDRDIIAKAINTANTMIDGCGGELLADPDAAIIYQEDMEKRREAIKDLLAWDDFGGDSPEMLSDAIDDIREAFNMPKEPE